MPTVFVIDGGAGRAIAAIPALRKFHRLNPKKDFRILVFRFRVIFSPKTKFNFL